MSDDHSEFLSGPDVQRRYGISDVTLSRWIQNAAMRFPQPIVVTRSRRLFRRADLVAWERSREHVAA